MNSKLIMLLLLAVCLHLQVAAQQSGFSITGTVTDSSGQQLAGATIALRPAGINTLTDARGSFSFNDLKAGTYSIRVSFKGYENLVKEVIIPSQGTYLRLQLNKNYNVLDEVVTVAYGKSKFRDLTGVVSSLNEKAIKDAPMGSTIQSLLQGRAAGVDVAIQSASPTSPISVVIRGASSLSGDNQPLWVIDGVPQYNVSTTGNIANTLYNLNINDVEGIDILKDASATALYGSRASNGVVIVTTKRGKNGAPPLIEFSSRIGYSKLNLNGYKYFTAPDYLRFADAAAREEAFGRGTFDYFTRLYLDEQAFFNLKTSEFDRSDFKTLDGAYYEGNTNWLEEMTQNPIQQQYSLALRGGTNNLAYYVSLNHQNMQGIVKSGQSKIYGGRVSLEARLRNNIKFSINLDGSSRLADDKDYMLDVLKKIRPDIPVYNEDGTLFTRDPYTENPYTTIKNTDRGNGQVFSGTAALEWTILKGLIFKTAFTNNYNNGQNLEYKRRGSTFEYTGSRSWNNARSNVNVWENTLTYLKTWEKHDLLLLGGWTAEKYKSTIYSMRASDFPDDDILNNFGSGATLSSMGEAVAENALVSQFARAQYKFNNRYILSGTLRRDGSSRFGPGRRWGNFPSYSAAWLVSEEEFIKNSFLSKAVSYLKLRASRGKAGSQNLGNYDWRTQVTATRYNELPAIIPSSIGNEALQWEQTRMTDVGIDYGFWNDRIRGSVGYYVKNTSDLIYSSVLPPSSSFSSINSNIAAVDNKGFEFDLKVDVAKRNNLTITLDFNAASNKNSVQKINNVAKALYYPYSGMPDYAYMKLEEGQRSNQWWGYRTLGRLFVTAEEVIAQQGRTATGGKQPYRTALESPGDLIFDDINGDGKITADDKIYLGSADPKWLGGFGATLIWKNFYVNTTFTYSYGNKRLWDMPMQDVGYVGNYNHSNLIAGQSATLLGPYEATIPRMTQYGDGGNSTFSDFWLYDASYIRLSALNLSYRLPSKLFHGSIVSAVDITGQATNLFTITKYPGFDPQGNWSSSTMGTGMGIDYSTYPSARIFNLGVKLTFQ
ncbi:SusC/RagA family TonB-linked outer membrane protein [Niabella sp. CJ426]|uniref:SusC/RagA family TonB-linked outer membrane protein n=1 Tax=Niabella sp. CJ426 TaxID=3393740 RepID=UPI003D01B495